MKWRLEFEADEWLSEDLEAYKTQHSELDFKKDIVQNYILSLKSEIEYLKKAKEYEKEAEKPVEAPSRSPPEALQQAQASSKIKAYYENVIQQRKTPLERPYPISIPEPKEEPPQLSDEERRKNTELKCQQLREKLKTMTFEEYQQWAGHPITQEEYQEMQKSTEKEAKP